MTNREKLQSMAIYDLLCRMQDNQDEMGENDCILDYVAGHEVECIGEHPFPNCKACIAAWLNEEVRE